MIKNRDYAKSSVVALRFKRIKNALCPTGFKKCDCLKSCLFATEIIHKEGTLKNVKKKLQQSIS